MVWSDEEYERAGGAHESDSEEDEEEEVFGAARSKRRGKRQQTRGLLVGDYEENTTKSTYVVTIQSDRVKQVVGIVLFGTNRSRPVTSTKLGHCVTHVYDLFLKGAPAVETMRLLRTRTFLDAKMPKRDDVSLRTFREEETRRRDFDDFEEACERNLEPEAFADESTLHHRPILSQSTEQQLEDYPGHSMGDLVERLFEAVELGNVSLLQRLIELSVKMHAPANSRRSLAEIARLDIWARRKQDDRSLLHHACYCDRNGVVRFLLGDTYRDSRSVNTIDSEYMTPLHIVCSRGNEVATRLLLRYGVKVNARSRFGYTPLHHAAASGSTQTVTRADRVAYASRNRVRVVLKRRKGGAHRGGRVYVCVRVVYS